MIAITGAAGFIGSNLALRLAGRGHDLLLADHPLTPDKAANLVGLSRFRLLAHDVFLEHLRADRPRLKGLFHLGACSRTTETDRVYLRRNNVDYSRAVWNWCAANGCPLVYASSAATYGDGSLGFDDRTPPERLRPLNPYGESKNDFDAWVVAQVRAGRPTPPGWAGLKFFNVYGPREGHKDGMASVVWQAYHQIAETGGVRLFRSADRAVADGGQRRDFVFVGDCIAHMLWLWEHSEVSGIYNSGTGTARTFLDLVGAVFTALGREPVVRFVDMPQALAGRYQNFTRADVTKLTAAGYACPPTTLEYGVLATVEWLRERSRTPVVV
jgi:ADP-L-glycero-D-manno-heptose 6-epimerase